MMMKSLHGIALLAACQAVDRDVEQTGQVSAASIDLIRAALAGATRGKALENENETLRRALRDAVSVAHAEVILPDARLEEIGALANEDTVAGTQLQAAIDDILTNDEASSDEELIAHFQQEMGLTAYEAQKAVSRRDHMLNALPVAQRGTR
jgi:hypothetical protein